MAHNKYKLCLHLSDLMQNTTCDDSRRWPLYICMIVYLVLPDIQIRIVSAIFVRMMTTKCYIRIFGQYITQQQQMRRQWQPKSNRTMSEKRATGWVSVMTQKYDESEIHVCACVVLASKQASRREREWERQTTERFQPSSDLNDFVFMALHIIQQHVHVYNIKCIQQY